MMSNAIAKGASIALAAIWVVSTPARSEAACAHDDFYEFLMAFQGNPTEQAINSADQIVMTTRHKTGSDMPKLHVETKDKEDLDWPVMPPLDELGKRDFKYRFYQLAPHAAELTAADAEGVDGFLTWSFEKKPCWRLVGYTDALLRP